MPSKKTAYYGNEKELSIDIQIINEQNVYFVGENIEFELTLHNHTGKEIVGGNRTTSPLELFLGYGSGTHDHTRNLDLEFESIPANESITRESETEYLPVQANGVIAVRVPKDDGSYFHMNDDDIVIKSNHLAYENLYSFTIWDEEFYNLHYEEPKKMQASANRLTRWVVRLAVVQVLFVLFQVGVLIYLNFL